MSVPILILGESGSGKTTSIRNLDPTETFMLKIVDKPFPYLTGNSDYTLRDSYTNPNGNLYITDDYQLIIQLINSVAKQTPSVKNIIIDDFQYCMAFEYMRRATETGYTKFTEIAQHTYEILQFIHTIKKDINIIFLTHSETTETGKIKCKTVGKLIDEKVCIEGLFTIVLNALVDNGKYLFLTQNLGNNIAKSPLGMFKNNYIANDLKIVLDQVNSYYKNTKLINTPTKE